MYQFLYGIMTVISWIAVGMCLFVGYCIVGEMLKTFWETLKALWDMI